VRHGACKRACTCLKKKYAFPFKRQLLGLRPVAARALRRYTGGVTGECKGAQRAQDVNAGRRGEKKKKRRRACEEKKKYAFPFKRLLLGLRPIATRALRRYTGGVTGECKGAQRAQDVNAGRRGEKKKKRRRACEASGLRRRPSRLFCDLELSRRRRRRRFPEVGDGGEAAVRP